MVRHGIIVFLFFASGVSAQDYSEKAILDYRKELNREFASESESPLEPADRAHFKSLDFFPPDAAYYVIATFVRTPDEKPFPMKTSTSRTPMYVKYGELHFALNGKTLSLNLYKSAGGKDEFYFLPFTDLTNGEETYSGGRYIDMPVPQRDTVAIDFNKAYNPYCAYGGKYSCPKVPAANDLPVAIRAGVKKFHD